MKKGQICFKMLRVLMAVSFFTGTIGLDILSVRLAYAESLNLPPINQFVSLSNSYSFPVLKGLRFDPNNPLTLEFIVDTAHQKNVTEQEASSLVKYFLAALTIPEEEIWVNLSPYEQDRIIPENLGQTDLGKDLLSQDYILKQLTSSLTYPESDTGKDYWEKTYAEVLKIARTTNLPVNTFNKIWIVPDRAQVYENENIAVIAEASLKVMLEEDYLTLKNKTADIQKEKKNLNNELIEKINKASSGVMRETILPQINKDINSGKNFATLRQIYHSLILGLWFKQKFQDSLYAHYINQGKIQGIDLQDKAVKEKIYNHYVEAFKTGLYDYVKNDYDPGSRKNLKRRYYSGGFSLYSESGFLDIKTVTKPLFYIASLLRTYIGGPAKSLVVRLEGASATGPSINTQLSKDYRKTLKKIKANTVKAVTKVSGGVLVLPERIWGPLSSMIIELQKEISALDSTKPDQAELRQLLKWLGDIKSNSRALTEHLIVTGDEELEVPPEEREKTLSAFREIIAPLNNIAFCIKKLNELSDRIEKTPQQSSSSMVIPFKYKNNPEERKLQIVSLLAEIDKELDNPGTGNLPKFALISDFHGAVERFAALLSYTLNRFVGFKGQLNPNESIEKQLNAQGLSLKDMKGAIILGGDLLDRGPKGLQCFNIAKELIETAPDKVSYISGNHDLWAFLNLMGFHLPWYEGFKFYGDTEAEAIIANKRATEKERFDTKEALLWWTERLAEYNVDQEKWQKSLKLEDLRNQFIEFYKTYSPNWNNDQLDAMENFIGHFKRIDVPDPYVGLNGVGKTSTGWWGRLHKKLTEGLEARKNAKADPEELKRWEEAIHLADNYGQQVRARLEDALYREGKWWYPIFESINDQAYKSVEWWGKDWSSHKDWGEAVIKELNTMLKDTNNKDPLIEQDRQEFKGQEVTQANYIRSHKLQDLAVFYKNNFNLYVITPYSELVTHGLLPIENGQIAINYKGKKYTGKEVFIGLRAISEDVKQATSDGLGAIWEALNLVNSWYADYTTISKPRDERKLVEKGFASLLSSLGVTAWIVGHNPANKVGLPFLTQDAEDSRFAYLNSDLGMADKFGGAGAVVYIGPKGIGLRGFESKESKQVIDNPYTLIPAKKEGEPPTIIQNPGMEAKEYLGNTRAALEKELKALAAPSALSTHDKKAVGDWITAAIEVGAAPVLVPESLRNAENQKREYVIGGNWKMVVNSAEEARQLMRNILDGIAKNPFFFRELGTAKALDIVISIAPSFVHLQAVAEEFSAYNDVSIPYGLVRLAAQDVSAFEPGARTGEVSAQQLKDLGVDYVIVGHSENRRHPLTPESSKSVNLKAKLALKYGLMSIIAVGETLEARDAGKTYNVIFSQLLESIAGLTEKDMEKVVIAYEPVWAIGTGKTATPEQADEVQRFIRALILEKYGYETASKVRIQYGGSVNEKNIAELIAQPNIDGGLIGGASLKSDTFINIVESALKHFRGTVSSALKAGVAPQANKDWTRGGIDMQGMNVGTSGASSPLNFKLPFDGSNFSGFTFEIVAIKEINDFDALVSQPQKDEKKLTSAGSPSA